MRDCPDKEGERDKTADRKERLCTGPVGALLTEVDPVADTAEHVLVMECELDTADESRLCVPVCKKRRLVKAESVIFQSLY